MQGIRVVVVDDHELLLEALVTALDAQDDIDVVVAANSMAAFSAQPLDDLNVDVVVTDLALSDGSGTEVARVSTDAGCAVLLMTGQGDREGVQAAVESGCAGFIGKGASVNELASAIRVVAEGGSVFPAALLHLALAPSARANHGITEREMAVLERLAQGKNAAEIATELDVSLHTARNHIRALLTKLDATSQLGAVVVAVRAGLVSIE